MLALEFGWRDLLFANWPVPPDAIAERLPDPLAVQQYDDAGWLTIVPFVNVDVRPRGLPSWLGFDLPELNLRTYVTHDGEPGVFFFSLDAQGLASVLSARLTHRLPYYYASLRLRRSDGGVAVRSRRRHPGARAAHFDATYRPTGDSFEADPGSRAAFLTERRRLYAQAQDGSIRYTDVAHPRWPLYRADATIAENTLFAASGFPRPRGDPICLYSPGVDVVTSRSERHG